MIKTNKCSPIGRFYTDQDRWQVTAGRLEEKAYILSSTFDTINRRNEQPTTENIIFSSPETMPTIKR